MAAACTLMLLATMASADYDVVVYGATPSGVAAAAEAGRAGYAVALYEPTTHIGGLTSGGLSNTDFRSFQSLGGAWKEFMDSVLAYYVRTYGEGSEQVADAKLGAWYEPRVARQVFETMLADADVAVFTRHELVSAQTVAGGSRTRITGITTRRLPDSAQVNTAARVFIDASYEGDLAAATGNPFHLGQVMAYNFRLMMSHDPDNQISFADVRPDEYDSMDFSGFRSYLLANPTQPLNWLVKIRTAPNDKADFNDMPKRDYHYTIQGEGWCEGSFPYRKAMYDLAKVTATGFFHFLATDEALASHPIQADAQQWGYAADEYVDTDNFTPALYVRQGRRIVGDYRMTSSDQDQESGSERSPAMSDAVAIGDYNHSVHSDANDYGLAVDDFLDPSAEPTNDWGTAVPDDNSSDWGIPPYPISYGSIVPRNVNGLLVPVALSADIKAYSSIRMEPTWTALGQAAGAAAALALDNDIVAPGEAWGVGIDV